MKKETLEALKGSIEKWTGDVVDKGGDNCPLCVLFDNGNCEGCPVYLKTIKVFCLDTPYDEWNQHHRDAHKRHTLPFRKVKGCDDCTRTSNAMRDFLKSLLPKETP